MKKFIIPIMMLLPLTTLQAQTVLTEQQQLEQAQKQLEQAKKALEIAKKNAEAARIKAQADSLNREAEKVKAETEKMKAETEKMKANAEKVKAEAKKVEANAAKTEPTPAISNEPTTAKGGWAIPTAVAAKKVEEKNNKNVTKVNGVVLKEDPKYLEGAVKLNAEGKVEFTLDTDANGKSAQQIYDIVYQYMSELTQGDKNIASRMALVNPSEHIIANTMDEWLVFNQSFISLDRTEFKYTLVAKISDNHLNLTLDRINYIYEANRATGFKEPAENVIVDKIALTKKKNDLAKIFGKFRRCTIDRKDQIFSELTNLLKQ